jgi:outer membrane immunogenic protein
MHMTRLFLRLSLAAAALISVSSAAMSADLLPPPPPPEELRPATYDWSGAYVGAYAAVVSNEGHYRNIPDCPAPCAPTDPEMSGTGYAGGVLAGYNMDFGGWVLGIEGDWGWGGEVAQNRDPRELTDLSFDNIATVRARAGAAFDDTLVYVTGGAAFVNAEVGTDEISGVAYRAEDDAWLTGWVVGGGIEHAFTDWFHGRLEYLYMDLPSKEFRLEDPNGFGGFVDMDFDGIHMVRAALTYNFSW